MSAKWNQTVVVEVRLRNANRASSSRRIEAAIRRFTIRWRGRAVELPRLPSDPLADMPKIDITILEKRREAGGVGRRSRRPRRAGGRNALFAATGAPIDIASVQGWGLAGVMTT